VSQSACYPFTHLLHALSLFLLVFNCGHLSLSCMISFFWYYNFLASSFIFHFLLSHFIKCLECSFQSIILIILFNLISFCVCVCNFCLFSLTLFLVFVFLRLRYVYVPSDIYFNLLVAFRKIYTFYD